MFSIDQDECQTDNGGCAEKCINTIGSYNCECNKVGYALISDSKPCEGLFLVIFFGMLYLLFIFFGGFCYTNKVEMIRKPCPNIEFATLPNIWRCQ